MRRFYAQSPRNRQQPLNKFSLGIIILIDLFILWQVFGGLSQISRWPLSPDQAYPCYGAWVNYREQVDQDKITTETRDIQILRNSIVDQSIAFSPNLPPATTPSLAQRYREDAVDHLGKISPICMAYARARDALNTPSSRILVQDIQAREEAISQLEAKNAQIRQEYDSTLLEQIAGQPQSQSINAVGAAQAKATLEANNAKIATLNQEKQRLGQDLIQQPPSQAFLSFLNQGEPFNAVEAGYIQARFWHPTQQLLLQILFLAPLILIASFMHRWAWQRNFGLLALISWHLLVIFLIPIVFKLFEVLQFGVIFSGLVSLITALFGSLLFLVNYVYILLVPLVGFGLIKFGQRFLFNPPSQASHRLQKSRCLNCGRKIQAADAYCPHCGFEQYHPCPHCHQPTYRYLPFCKACGAPQNSP